MDETQLWVKSNGGHRLARTLRRNAAKTDGRTLELSNAHELGEESIAEETQAHFDKGRPGILFEALRPSVEPSPDMDDDELNALLAQVYAGAPWIDVARIFREVRDPGAPWPETQRFFFNLPTAGNLAAIDPQLWHEQTVDRRPEPGERICLGFDGSHSGDATAIVGCTEKGHLFLVELFERPADLDDWRVDRARVQRTLEEMFKNYNVGFLYADPWRWQTELEEWAARWPDRVVELPTNSTRRMPAVVDRFRTALAEHAITHDGDQDLRRHVLNGRLRKAGRDLDGRGSYMLEKAGPGRLIDALVAAMLTYEAATQIPEPPPEKVPLVMWA